MRPFGLPWNDDAPSVTDFSALNSPIATDSPRLTVNAEGQLGLAGARQRMIGVNFTGESAFPQAADAAAIAGRLAKFGFNTVRFHHLEAPWAAPNVLVDYTGDTSRNLSAFHLDRLHRFIAELADEGIYTNMNLLVSRQFYPNDGFPAAVADLEWKSQQALSFFNDHMVTLQKEYAQQLLAAPNPYRGHLPLAADPALGFVEILNEYGFLQAWHDGVLDTLPAAFADGLVAHWNAWLALRYANTAAVLQGWEAIDEPPGPPLLNNPNFAAGATGWNLERHDTAVATAISTNTFTGSAPALRIAVTTAGSATWHVQLNQAGQTLTAGQIYTASYWARSADGLPLTGMIGRASGDFAGLFSVGSATLDNTWREFSTTFVASADEPAVRFNFNGFGNQTGTLEIAAVAFATGGQAGTLPAGVSLELRNIPITLKNGGSATAAQRRDWFRYLIASEQVYWDTMYSYIKDDLGYPGIVFGTIVANSPAGVQARLDAVDSHFYWAHPIFPNVEWDPNDWYLGETDSAVNSTTSHVGAFARQRVAGKPFFNTEYQHVVPNKYSGEAPLIPAAYGAFQDWDGFWFFEYGAGGDQWDRGYMSNYFGIDTDPTKMANVLLAAAMFRRGDVDPARTSVTVGFDPDAQLAATLNGRAWSVGDGSHLGLSTRHAFTTRVALDTTAPFTSVPPAPTGDVLTSDTGQLVWDNSQTNRGVVTVDTPRTKAVFGFAENRSFDLEGWVFTPGDTRLDWLTAGVTSVAGESLQSTAGMRALVIVTGERASTGWNWPNAAENSLGNNWGGAPTLIEVVPLTLEIPHPAARVNAWALDETGARLSALSVTSTPAGARLELGQNGDTLWYEIAVAADPTLTGPEISLHPEDRLLAPGDSGTIAVTATGSPPLTYQWFRDGDLLPAATSPQLTLSPASAEDSGRYEVTVANAQGSVTSRASLIRVEANPAAFAGLINLSTRANSGSGDALAIPGFVLVGSGQKELLVRAVGPGLEPFGITDYLPDPSFSLLASQSGGEPLEIAANDNWDAAMIGDAFTQTGAFGLADGSADAALRTIVGPGSYTAPVVDRRGEGGLTIVELYDMEIGLGDLRVMNLATRGPVGSGADQLIAGFAIPGELPRRVLVRAIGPTLADFGVSNAVTDPKLEIVALDAEGTPQRVAANDDWFRDGNAGNLGQLMGQVGAFPLPAASRDAVSVVELAPGSYTVLVSATSPGIALVEIYAID